jgi:hypothetical protein
LKIEYLWYSIYFILPPPSKKQESDYRYAIRTFRKYAGFKKLKPNLIFVNACMTWVYEDTEKYFAHFAQN